MNRKLCVVLCLAVVLVLGVALSAGAQGKKMDLGGQRLGIIFNVPDILMNVENSSDGLMAGLGLKYWLKEKTAIRGLLEFTLFNPGAGTTTTTFGLDGAFEYHFAKGKVSPYTGGIAGIEITSTTGSPVAMGLILGGILGVEVRVLDYLGLFAEYNLRIFYSDPEFDLVLGMGNNASLGVIVYLP
jgi:hypothetical protein